MKKFFVILALIMGCSIVSYSQTMNKDTLVLITPKAAKAGPVSTGHYVQISKSKGGELVYRSTTKNKEGNYSYFVLRTSTKTGQEYRYYLTVPQREAFIAKYGEK